MFFVKYPPEGDEGLAPTSRQWQPHTYLLDAEHAAAQSALERLGIQYDQHRNPLYALEAVHLANAAKVYPPLWALEVIGDLYRRAMLNDQSLDRAFGLTYKGMGSGRRPNSIALHDLRMRDAALCMVVMKLEALGLRRRAACKATSELLNRLPDHQAIQHPSIGAKLVRMNLSDAQIKNAVEAIEHEFEAERGIMEKQSQAWSAEDRRDALRVFFPTELPKSVARSIGLKS